MTTVNDLGSRPHHIDPAKQTVRVALSARNFGAPQGISHIGLSVTNLNNARVLRRAGYYVEVCHAQDAAEIDRWLTATNATAARLGRVPVSHFVINSPSWVPPADIAGLCGCHPDVMFVLQNHTGTAYLSMDGVDVWRDGKKTRIGGIRSNRECIDLERDRLNFRVSCNNPRFHQWMLRTFAAPCLHLPNLYDTEAFVDLYPRDRDFGDTIRIGSFGAPRPHKNQLTAAQAAVMIARQMGVNLELYYNNNRYGNDEVAHAREDLFRGAKDLALVPVPWENWPEFRRTVGHMHLLMQPSTDETFNVVTADGIAAGVPSVTSSCIEWTPRQWWCDPCDPNDAAKVGLYLLNDRYAAEEGRSALRRYVSDGLSLWERFLTTSR